MKKTAFFIALNLLALAAKSQSTDELAIQKTCEAETRAWLEADAAAFNNLWQIRPYTRILVTTEDGQTITVGADQMKAVEAAAMGGGGTFANSNYLIHVDGNSAWAIYDEEKTAADGSKHPSHEMRLLEKVDGAWKLVGMSVHHYKPK